MIPDTQVLTSRKIYRCWMIWGRHQWIVILPSILSLTSFAGSLALVAELGIEKDVRDFDVFPGWWTPLGVASYCVSLAVNALVTLLMVLKIWIIYKAGRNTEADINYDRHNSLQPVIAMLLESGAMVFIAQVFYVLFFELRHPGWYVISGPVVMIYGINPTVVIVRASMRKSYAPRVEYETSINFAPANVSSTNDESTTQMDILHSTTSCSRENKEGIHIIA
ncbi:hypothetical protein BDQ17DRAFT_1316292 [Cyathus striatus]|nr:hypothetical protein BDQ17DRAFT_1316292 [Cyathus striatus]